MSDDVDGAAWAWERLAEMAQRWIDTPEWHEPAFHDGKIHVTTAELHAAAILCYRKDLGVEPATPTDPVEACLAVGCPTCGPDHTELGHAGFPCLDVGGGRVQMVCLSRIRAALTSTPEPRGPATTEDPK